MLCPHDMSKRTTIYVLFKEYPDSCGREKSAPYIQDSTDYLVNRDAVMRDWREVEDVLDYFGYEMVNRYYDEENLAGLLYVADTIPEEYPSVSDTIRSEMQSTGLTSWRTDAVKKTEAYFLGQNEVTDDLLGDMAQRKDKECVPCVLLHHGAVEARHGEVQITMRGGRSLQLPAVDTVIDMHSWLSHNRVPCRQYKFHPKHGDAHKKAQNYVDRLGHVEPAAQLLTTTEETETLLKQAVGLTVNGDLWFYDQAHACHIYFENQGENPQHEYHAYHLRPGEKNYNKIDFIKLNRVLPVGTQLLILQ